MNFRLVPVYVSWIDFVKRWEMKQICPNRIISICFSQIKGPLVLQDRSCQTLTETLGRECLSEYSHTRVTVPPSSFTPVFIDAEKKADSFFTAKNLFKNKISHQLNWIESNSHILMFFKMFILFIKFKTSCTLPSLQSLS